MRRYMMHDSRYTLAMSPLFSRMMVGAGLLALVGAGCTTAPVLPVAEPFEQFPSQREVAAVKGFGVLPVVAVPRSTAVVTIEGALPDIPAKVTVLRLRSGLPNETELRNVTNALRIPSGLLGRLPQSQQLEMRWKDTEGATWTYDATRRGYAFARATVDMPLTVAVLPHRDSLLNMASTFLKTHGLNVSQSGDALFQPDWNNWWEKQQQNGQCMDAAAVHAVREFAAQQVRSSVSLPILPFTKDGNCVAPEFPAVQHVSFPALMDGRLATFADGTPVVTAELELDAARTTVMSGSIAVFDDADRSDYPAVTAAQLRASMEAGGLSGTTGSVKLTSFEIQALLVEDAAHDPLIRYLVPDVIGLGIRTRPDGNTEPFRIVVPLVAR